MLTLPFAIIALCSFTTENKGVPSFNSLFSHFGTRYC